jgi:hypothetical protein
MRAKDEKLVDHTTDVLDLAYNSVGALVEHGAIFVGNLPCRIAAEYVSAES